MKYNEEKTKVYDLKIAYIGGGSSGWARGLMSDLAYEEALNGTVYLYDIDFQAAKNNEIIGNKISEQEEANSKWKYKAVETLKEALQDADFVIISILPGTMDEMESDVHTPEKYGIYQSVGDTTGPGGIVRALRTIPMFKTIAEGVRDYCPNAWVINYTNPMTMCVTALYKYFPKIKAFGCCHEVFGTQHVIEALYYDKYGVGLSRDQTCINVVGINHFTWITEAHAGTEDLFPLYSEAVDKYYKIGYGIVDKNWFNSNDFCQCGHRVKFDLFKRYGVIAAAGDRHLAEFCPGKWYLESPEKVREWMFKLTPVSYRRNDYDSRYEYTRKLVTGEEQVKLSKTGEEGTRQMKGILGLGPLVTNVNIINRGQIGNLPEGFIVETNASFTSRGVQPIVAGAIPQGVDNLVGRVAYNQMLTVESAMTGNYELAFRAFVNDPLVTCSLSDARKLFDEMLFNTAKYLPNYNKKV